MSSDTLSVFLSYQPKPEHLIILRNHLEPGVKLAYGEDLPDGADFEVLVNGRPDENWLTISNRLRALVIPFAGLPDTTAKVLRKFPELRVYNLHHNALPVAEMVIGLVLSVARKIAELDRTFRKDDWTPRYGDNTGFLLLHGRRVLILGYGHVGREIGRLCSALGMQVSAVRREPSQPEQEGISVYSTLDLPQLLSETQVLIVCVPLTPETRMLLDANMLSRLPGEAILVNVGRADVIDEEALFLSLKEAKIAGAGLDVWFNYPSNVEERPNTPPSSFPFKSLPNVVITPHVAGKVQGTEDLRMRHLARLLNQIAAGEEPQNQIDVDRGY
jgi:phosphoglycerate dehydrogenase-like enzyme